jgi:hypothetical protein
MLDELGNGPGGNPGGRFFVPFSQRGPPKHTTHEARARMVLITPDEGPTGLTTSINALEQQLADMRADLAEIYQRIRSGDLDELKNATKATTEIRQWLKIALEAEAQLERRRKEDLGIVHGYALDFDDARHQIGCRLDRLKRASCHGRLPRCPE